MSECLYPTLLRFDGGHGCAKIPGVYRNMGSQPHIHGIPAFETIDYGPAPHEDHPTIARIRPYDAEERDMTATEMRAADRWLERLKYQGES